MYGLPEDFDGGFLLGKTLETICFGRYQMWLHFDGQITITIESSFSYEKQGTLGFPVMETAVIELIASSVSGVKGDVDGSLSLSFSNGKVLRINDDSSWYESYSISYDGKRLIV